MPESKGQRLVCPEDSRLSRLCLCAKRPRSVFFFACLMFSIPARECRTSTGSGGKNAEAAILGIRRCVNCLNLDLRVRSGCLRDCTSKKQRDSQVSSTHANVSLPSFVEVYESVHGQTEALCNRYRHVVVERVVRVQKKIPYQAPALAPEFHVFTSLAG